MLRQAKYPITNFSDTVKFQEYKIAANDLLQIEVYSNNGEKIIDPFAEKENTESNNNNYLVEFDGSIKVPMLGRISMAGQTIREAEVFLENKFKNYIVDPFVTLKILNHRVIIFPGGEGSQAVVVSLDNPNTTVLEALAKAGGINDGKAKKIKLIRGDLKNPTVYHINLSTVEGMTQANMVLQANDIIYVEPRAKVPEKIALQITPYISLLTAAILIYSLFIK
jgi:polysaccharide export outer membrane protein